MNKNEEIENEEIVDVLEDKTLDDNINEYYKLRIKIENMLKKLKNYGVVCECDECYEFTIDAGSDESQKVCITCGGYIRW